MKKNYLNKLASIFGIGMLISIPIILTSCSNTPKSINILEKLPITQFDNNNIPSLDGYPKSDGTNASELKTNIHYDLYDNGYQWLKEVSPLYNNMLNSDILISEVYGTLIEQATSLNELIDQPNEYGTKLNSFEFDFKKFNYYQTVSRVDLYAEIKLAYFNNNTNSLDHESKIIIDAEQANGWYDVKRSDNPGATYSYPCLKIQGGITIDGQTTSKGIVFCYFYNNVEPFRINLDYNKK